MDNMSSINVEESTVLHLDFKKIKKACNLESDVIPVAVQDYASKEVLIIGYVNDEAFQYTAFLISGALMGWIMSANLKYR